MWHDHAYLRLPAYRDRVVEIWLEPEEGGINLDMPKPVIDALVERGRRAGQRLCARFADAPATEPLSWEAHRWARLRSGMEALANYLQAFERTVQRPLPGDGPLSNLFGALGAPPAYRFDSEEQLNGARAALDGLRRWIAALERDPPWSSDADPPFGDSPKPRMEVGTRAPI